MVRSAQSQTNRFVERCDWSDDDLSFRGTIALISGALKSKGEERTSTHYNADPATAKLLLRITISVSQLSIYGAVADRSEKLAQQISSHSSTGTWIPVVKMNNVSESIVASADVSILIRSSMINVPAQGNSMQQRGKIPKNLLEYFPVSEASDDTGFIGKIPAGQCFVTFQDI